MSVREKLAFVRRWNLWNSFAFRPFNSLFARLRRWKWSVLLAFLPLLMCPAVPALLNALDRFYRPEHYHTKFSYPVRGLNMPDGLYSYVPWENFDVRCGT